MLPQSEFESLMFANAPERVAIAAITQEGALAGMAERLRNTWPDLVLVVVGTAEEQSKVAAQITSGVVYRFLHRPVSAPRVRLFVDAALRRHEVENVERTLEHIRPDFSRLEAPKKPSDPGARAILPGIIGAVAVVAAAGLWFALLPRSSTESGSAPLVSQAPVEPPPPAGDRPKSAAAPRTDAQPTPEPTRPPARNVTALPAPVAASPAPSVALPTPTTPEESVPGVLRPAASGVVQVPDEATPQTPPPDPLLSHEQKLRNMLSQAEAALQRGELASPAGRNAVALFTGALELDPGNALAKGGLVRVADRLLSAAERALTAGSVEDAKNMVAVAENLTPATARGAFLMMQIEMEQERTAVARAKESAAQDRQSKGETYLRLAEARLRSGALIEPTADNARFYLEAARELLPGAPALQETSRALQKVLLDRASGAADAGNASDTERWLANADGAGASRQDMTAIRRSLQDTLIGARADRMNELTRSFNSSIGSSRLLQPVNDNAKAHLLALINTDASSPAVASARQTLGAAYATELRGALTRGDLNAATSWLTEAQTIGYANAELSALDKQVREARDKAAQRSDVVGANSLQRLEYVAPRFPASTRNRGVSGWVEVEFTVRADGSTGDIAVTNSSPRKTFDSAATAAVSQWRYKPVVRDGKPAEQRAAVRIRFSDE
jgi:TonB family protein